MFLSAAHHGHGEGEHWQLQMGFVTFGVIAAAAFGLVVLHRTHWLEWTLRQKTGVAPAVVQGVEASAGN